jgi:DNA-binding NtrC family response regulator
MKQFERDLLVRTLASFDGKKAMAAEALGISRKNLWEKLKAHGIGVLEGGALLRVAGEPSAGAGVP